MYKIEKNVPVVKTRSKWPFGKMEVGDSFIIPKGDYINMNNIYSAASHYGKRHGGMKFTTKACDEGRRVWRIK